jgi:hypothetical protein
VRGGEEEEEEGMWKVSAKGEECLRGMDGESDGQRQR